MKTSLLRADLRTSDVNLFLTLEFVNSSISFIDSKINFPLNEATIKINKTHFH